MRKIISLIITAALVTAVFAGCAEKNDDIILIGVLSPTSGSEAYYGKDMVNSFQLAVDEINEAGGVLGRQLKLYAADDANDPNTSVQAANRIISQNVDFVVGGYGSGATIPTLQLFHDDDLLMLVSCANSTDITALGLTQTFMINSPGTHAVMTLADLLAMLGSKRIALIHQGDAYTKNLSDICERELPSKGYEIATVQVMEAGSPDVSAIVTAIIQSDADFVYWCGYHADGSNVIKQLRRGGYTGDIAVGDGSASVELITACGEDGEDVYVTSPPFVEFAQGGEEFVAAYKAKYGDNPGTYATLCYDTIYLLKEAIEKADSTDTAAVRGAVAGITYNGLSGIIKFGENREPEISNFIILQIKDNAFTLVNP